MTAPPAAPAPASRTPRLRGSARLRLTLLFTGMFLGLGTTAIVGTYVLTSATTTVRVIRISTPGARATRVSPKGAFTVPAPPGPPGATAVVAPRTAPTGASGVVVSQHNADLSGLFAVSWLALAVTAVASALLGWIAAGRVLRPLREMTDAAQTITAGNLDRRLALGGSNDEFKRLGDTLDDLLARLESAFDAQRRFVANASHELRTPLTLDRTLLQVALADPGASEATLRATCEELLASGRDQERLLEALLTLASSERGLDRRVPLDLSTLAQEALDASRPEIERRSLRLSAALMPAPTTGDPALIERLIANLVDNAVEYNEAGGGVEIRTARDDDRSLVTVANTGRELRAEEMSGLLEPFARVGGGRSAGTDGHHGLGLSIVAAIAHAHGAGLQARPRPGGGLEVTVSFAAAPVAGPDS